MNLRKYISAVILFGVAAVFSYCVLDTRIALLCGSLIRADVNFSRFASSVPDLLFVSVCVLSVISWTGYWYEKQRGGTDARLQFFRLVGVLLPSSFIVKIILKYAFGRTNTRVWFLNNESDAFHWFQGGINYEGFPSGHMTVYTALIAALWYAYPNYRYLYTAFLVLLAVAMIATNHHFLSDVLAGAGVGLLVYFFTLRGLMFFSRTQASPDPAQ